MKDIEVQTEIVSSVSATTKQEIEIRDPCEWTWVEASIWTDRMLAALGNGVHYKSESCTQSGHLHDCL